MDALREATKNAIEQAEMLPSRPDRIRTGTSKWFVVNQRTWILRYLRDAMSEIERAEIRQIAATN